MRRDLFKQQTEYILADIVNYANKEINYGLTWEMA